MPEPVIAARGLSKRLCRDFRRGVSYALRDLAREMVGLPRRPGLREAEFWALQEVSFDLAAGEILGLIGPNGAGKTTLLRILSRLIRPDAGTVTVRGRVVPLLALGAGFNAQLTGRENVQLNLGILGLTGPQIARQVDAIVAFAELGDAIDAPVQTYSSGMVARLGFATSVHAAPDVLLIDEAFAVGDVRFRTKCYQRLGELKQEGTAAVVVSHSHTAILSFCSRALYLSQGRLMADGSPSQVLGRYQADLVPGTSPEQGELTTRARRGGPLELTGLCLQGPDRQPSLKLTTGSPGWIGITGQSDVHEPDLDVHVHVRELSESEPTLSLSSARDGRRIGVGPGEFQVLLHLPECGLKPGTYLLKVWITRRETPFVHDIWERLVFQVEAGVTGFEEGVYHQRRAWDLRPPEPG